MSIILPYVSKTQDCRTQSAVLPVLSGWVLVLLKLLLATVTAAAGNPPQSATSGSFPPGVPSRTPPLTS